MYRLCELLGSGVTEWEVRRLLLLSRTVLGMGPGWGAVTHHSPKAGSCQFCSPTQHHNAASVPKKYIWVFLFICSCSLGFYSMFPSMVSDIWKCCFPLRPSVVRSCGKGFVRQRAVAGGSDGAMANESCSLALSMSLRINSAKKDLGDLDPLLCFLHVARQSKAETKGEQTSSFGRGDSGCSSWECCAKFILRCSSWRSK